jgi:hypothetical protein
MRFLKIILLQLAILPNGITANGQYDLSRILYVELYKKPGFEIKSLIATITPTSVNDRAKFNDETYEQKRDGNTKAYNYYFGALYTLDENIIYCTRIIKNKVDTAFIYVFIGDKGKNIFGHDVAWDIKNIVIDSFHFSPGTYLINFYNAHSDINKIIIKDLHATQLLKTQNLKPYTTALSTLKQTINRISGKKVEADKRKTEIEDSLKLCNVEYRNIEEKINEINRKYAIDHFSGYYYFDSLGFHVGSDAIVKQKISVAPLSPDRLVGNSKGTSTKFPEVRHEILSVFGKAKKKENHSSH